LKIDSPQIIHDTIVEIKYINRPLYLIQNINGTWDNDQYLTGQERWEVKQKDGDSIVYIFRNTKELVDIGVGIFDRTSNLFRIAIYREGKRDNCHAKFSFIWKLSKEDNTIINFSFRTLELTGGGVCGSPMVNKLDTGHHLIK